MADALKTMFNCSLKKNLVAVLLLIFISAPMAATAQQFGDFGYTLNGGGVTITNYTGKGGAVTIPASINSLPVTAIGHLAFHDNPIIISATIPASVTNIESAPFPYCRNLLSITVDSGNAFYTSLNGVLFDKNETAIIQCPATKAGSYSIPHGVTIIGGWTFDGCLGLTNIIIPDSVKSMGEAAFSDCYGLTSVTVPASVTMIDHYAFGHCYSLSRIFFPGNAPVADSTLFFDAPLAKVYYLPGTTGWGPSFSGVPAFLEVPAPPPPSSPHAATATANVVNGFVVGASITDDGWGYTNTPTVRIIGGGGAGSQAVAVVSNGVVVAVNLVNAGSGYTNTPVIVIAPPFIPQPTIEVTALSFGPLVAPVIKLDLANLSPYDNYQLEFRPSVESSWGSLGTPFTPTSSTNTQYASGVGNVGFFRVKYLP
jgi:hypothetical protein